MRLRVVSALCLRLSLLLLPVIALSETGVLELLAVDGCAERCPGDSTDGECPPGCDDCRCCPQALPAVMPAAGLFGKTASVALTPMATMQDPLLETHQRVFRPPRPELVC